MARASHWHCGGRWFKSNISQFISKWYSNYSTKNTMNCKFFSHIIQTLFPQYCLVCKRPGNYLCNNCKAKLIPHPEICPFCHQPSTQGKTCFVCQETNKTHLAGSIIAFCYSQEIKKCIYAIKFYHRYDIAHFLSERLALHIQSHPFFANDLRNTIITRVPSHRTRRIFQKGYNQSKILALETAKILGIPNIELVSKIKRTKSQVSLSRTQRLQNLLGVFQGKQNDTNNIPIWIKKVLIIDDITTTWATLEQIAKEIHRKNPSLELRWCVIARHH